MTISYEDELKRVRDEIIINNTIHFINIVEFSKLIRREMETLTVKLTKIKEQIKLFELVTSLGIFHLYLEVIERKFEAKSIYIMTSSEFLEIYSNLTNIIIAVREYIRQFDTAKESDAVKIEKEKRKTIIFQNKKEQQEVLRWEQLEKKKLKAIKKQNKKQDKIWKKEQRKRKQEQKNAKKIVKNNESKLRLHVIFNKHTFAKVVKHKFPITVPSYEVTLVPTQNNGNVSATRFFTFKEFETFLCREIKLNDVKNLSYEVFDIQEEDRHCTIEYHSNKSFNTDLVKEYTRHAMSYIDKSLIENIY
jgi:hypothetical protein